MIDSLLTFLKSKYKPGPGEFLQLDGGVLAEQLQLKKRGTSNGKLGQPPAASDIFDDVEHEIVSSIRSVATDAQDRTHDQIATYAQRLKSADISGAAAEMMALARQSVGDFQAEILNARGALRRSRLTALEFENALGKFKQRHRLDRPCTPPKDHIILGAILVIMFVIEIAPNAVILAAGEELGILGGMTQATIYSFLNIGFGFLAGRLAWPNLVHRNWLRKLLGLVGSLAIATFIVGLNFALAHYRSLAQTLPTEEAVVAAWRILFADPLAITDLKSAGMVAMGILFSFIATIEGWLWQDPYPGYAGLDRHSKDAETHYHDQVDEKIGHLKAVQESTVEKIKVERSRLRDKRQEVPLVIEERRRLIARFGSHMAHLQDVGRQLLSIYRSANRAAREDGESPEHFDQLWILNGFEPITLDDDVWHVPEERFREADQALAASIDQVQSSFENALRWVGRLSAIKNAEEVDAIMGQE